MARPTKKIVPIIALIFQQDLSQGFFRSRPQLDTSIAKITKQRARQSSDRTIPTTTPCPRTNGRSLILSGEVLALLKEARTLRGGIFMVPVARGASFSTCRAAAWRLPLKSSTHGRAASTTSQLGARLGGGNVFLVAGRHRGPGPVPGLLPHRVRPRMERPRNRKETSLQSRTRPHRFGTSHQTLQSQIRTRFPSATGPEVGSAFQVALSCQASAGKGCSHRH